MKTVVIDITTEYEKALEEAKRKNESLLCK